MSSGAYAGLDDPRWFATALRSIGDAVIATDASGCIVFMNSVAESLTGWPCDEATSRPLPEVFRIINETSRLAVANPVESVLRDGKAVALANHTILIRKDETELSIDDSAAPIHDEDGSLSGVVLVFRDISKQRQVERERDEQYRLAKLGADIGVALTSNEPLSKQLERCTDALVEHLGAAFARIWALNETKNVLELRASSGLYTHLDGPHARVPVGSFKIGRIAEERKPHLTNDVQQDPRVGDQEWARREGMVSFAGYPLVVEGTLVGVVGVFAKLPLGDAALRALESVADQLSVAIDRHASEVALKLSEQRYEFATRAARVAVWDWSLVSNSASWNEGVETLFGFTKSQVGADATWWYEMIHLEDRERVVEGIHHVIDAGGAFWRDEYRFRRADGTYALVFDNGYIARDPSGTAIRMVGAMLDVTELRKREQDLTNALRLNELFVGILGHDLRNPLGAMVTGAQLLEQALSDEKRLRTLKRMNSAGRRMTDMIDQLLDLTRARLADGLGFMRNRESLDVGELVRRATDELRGVHADRAIQIEVGGDGAAVGDAERLLQLFSNLVANALVHGSADAPVLVDVQGDARDIVVRVLNRGEIPAELLPTIFDPFRERPKVSRSRGLGLGLFISQQIATAHHGTVTVQSNEKAGTVFTVRLPRTLPKRTLVAVEGRQRTILIVDDDADIRHSLRDAFEANGYEASTAAGGAEALDLMKNDGTRPDVVILDLGLRVSDGKLAYHAMQDEPRLANIPVVILTASPAKAPAGVPVVPKPIEVDRLLERVAEFWKQEPAE